MMTDNKTISKQTYYQTFVQASQDLMTHYHGLELECQRQLKQARIYAAYGDPLFDLVEDVWGTVKTNFQALGVLEDAISPHHVTAPSLRASSVDIFDAQPPSSISYNELPLLYHLRNTAFFELMHAIQQHRRQAQQRVPDHGVFLHDHHQELIATTTFIKAYQEFEADQMNTLALIERNLTAALATQSKPWIELYIPAFILQYWNYETLSARLQKEVRLLTEQYQTTLESLEQEKAAFRHGWECLYRQLPPENLIVLPSDLATMVTSQHDPQFQALYQIYLEHTNTTNLVNFYRYACHKLYQSAPDQLAAITTNLTHLHPDMSSALSYEYTFAEKEQRFAKHLKQQWLLKRKDQKTNFLSELSKKYEAFLLEKNWEKFSAIHQHLMQAKHLHQDPTVAKIIEGFARFYPNAMAFCQQDHIPTMHPKHRDAWLLKYRDLDQRDPVYRAIMNCVYAPTWKNLAAVEDLIRDPKSYAHCQDKTFVDVTHDFMTLCVEPAPLCSPLAATVDQPEENDGDLCDFHSVASDLGASDHDVEAPTPVSYAKQPHVLPITTDDLDRQQYESFVRLQQLQAQQNSIKDPLEHQKYIKDLMVALTEHLNAIELKRYQWRYNQQKSVTDYCHLKIAIVSNPNNIRLSSTFEILTQHLSRKKQLELALWDVQTKLSDTNKPQSLSFEASYFNLLHNVFTKIGTLFTVLLMRASNKAYRKQLVEKQNQLKDELYVLQRDFEQTWQKNATTALPENLDSAEAQLEEQWYQLQNLLKDNTYPELEAHLEQFMQDRSANHLLQLYQQISVLRYYDPKPGVLNEVALSLQCLYPEQHSELQQAEQTIWHQLHSNDELYRLTGQIIAIDSPSRSLLHRKLVSFLNDKSEFNLKVLHQHVTTSSDRDTAVYCSHIIENLKSLYPNQLAAFDQQQSDRLCHIQDRYCCDLMLLQYAKKSQAAGMPLPILRQFLASPTTAHALAVTKYCFDHPQELSNPNHSELAHGFVTLCSKPTAKPVAKYQEQPHNQVPITYGFFQPSARLDPALEPVSQALLVVLSNLTITTMDPGISNEKKWEIIQQVRDLLHGYIKVITTQAPGSLSSSDLALIKRLIVITEFLVSTSHQAKLNPQDIQNMRQRLASLNPQQPDVVKQMHTPG